MPNRLLIIGASVRAAAFSAHRAGYRVVAADLFGDADLERYAESVTVIGDYPRGFERVLADEAYDRWMVTGALENFPELVQSWSETFAGYCGCSSASVRKVRSEEWRQFMADAGIRVPKQQTDKPMGAEAKNWLRKSRRSAGGLQVGYANRPALPNHRDESYFQEFVRGTLASAVYLATDGGCELLSVSEQLIGRSWGAPADFGFVGCVGPICTDHRQFAQWQCIGEVLASCCCVRGVFGVDAVVREGDVVPIEVNPRYPASAELVDRSGRTDSVVDLHLKSFERRPLNIKDGSRRSRVESIHAKAIVWADKHVNISTQMSDRLLGYSEEGDRPGKIADVPVAGTIDAGQPITTVFAAGKTKGLVSGRLRKRIEATRRLIDST